MRAACDRKIRDSFAEVVQDRGPQPDAGKNHHADKDEAAVAAALTQPGSNDQTEGQVTRLKLVKRQMFGRAKCSGAAGVRARQVFGRAKPDRPEAPLIGAS